VRTDKKPKQSFVSGAIAATKTASIYGLIRGAILTPLIEVPFTNIERQRQIYMQLNNALPKSGFNFLNEAIRSKNISSLLTGASANMSKNFLREMLKSYTWLSVPIASHYLLQKDDVHNCQVTKAATTFSVIIVNGTMNSIFDGVRNMQIDSKNFSYKNLSTAEAVSTIFKNHGALGFFKGASSTYLYSTLFWGSFSTSRHFYSAGLMSVGLKPEESLRDQCILNSMCGATSGLLTMPLEHIRYRIIGKGDLPSGVIAAFKQFHANHYAKVGIRAYFCGLSQSLPIQVSAGVLAGTLIFMQKKKALQKSENMRD